MSRTTLPLTFRAVGSSAPGAPLEPLTRTIQSLQPDEVLARVSYAAFNALDGKVYQSKANMFQLSLPIVLGYDFSGVIVALGTEGPYPGEAEALTVGSAVMGTTFSRSAIGATRRSLPAARLLSSADSLVRCVSLRCCVVQFQLWLLCRVRGGQASSGVSAR